MTKLKNTKRALCTSVLSFLLCVSMLVGSTFAWFTDTATTGVNTVTAGNLDIKLSYKNATATAYTEVSKDTKNLFVNQNGSEILWEPGTTTVCYFKLENLGTLALQYKLAVNYADTVTYGDVKLSDALESAIVDLTEDQTLSSTEIATKLSESSVKALGYADQTGVKMESKATRYFAIIVSMPTTVGNTYNLPANVSPLQIQLGINLVATQVTAEYDSFNNTYDKNAEFPEFVQVQFDPAKQTELKGKNVTATIPANTILTIDGDNGNTVSENTPIVLSVEPTVYDGNITVTEGTVAKRESYEISLTTNDGKKVTSSEPIEVSINIGKGRGTISLYHNDQLVPNTQYDYQTGMLTFSTNDFSPFTVVEIEGTTYVFTEGAHNINLTGKEITVSGSDIQEELAVVKVSGNSKASIYGDGTVKINAEDNIATAIAVWARNGGDVVIQDGTYILERSADSTKELELIYASDIVADGNLTIITIEGGTFKCDNPYKTINIHGNGQGNDAEAFVYVTGGTFWSFNPAADVADGGPEDDHVIVPEGFKVTSEERDDGTWYTVVKAES